MYVSNRAIIYGITAFLLTSLFLYLSFLGINYYLKTRTNYPMPGVLVMDLGRDGLQLTALNEKTTQTFFDFDSDNFASQTAWIGPKAVFLVTKVHEYKHIVEIKLFGGDTVDGFYDLARFDSNSDNKIDQSDALWGDLYVWADVNGDAVSHKTELRTLEEMNIKRISLKTKKPEQSRISGNDVKKAAKITFKDKSKGHIYLVSFKQDKVNSYFTGNYELNLKTLFLPGLRGYGRLPDLHIAMSIDESLLNLVEKEAQKSLETYLINPQKTKDDIERILFTWAKVADVQQDSRGPNIDARKLEFLEKFFGNKFRQTAAGGTPDPLPGAASLIMESWRRVYHPFKAQIIVQTGGKALFNGQVSYNPMSGTMEGEGAISRQVLANLAQAASREEVDTKAFWAEVADFLQYTKGLKNLTPEETFWLEEAVEQSSEGLSWAEFVESRMAEDTQANTAQIVNRPVAAEEIP